MDELPVAIAMLALKCGLVKPKRGSFLKERCPDTVPADDQKSQGLELAHA